MTERDSRSKKSKQKSKADKPQSKPDQDADTSVSGYQVQFSKRALRDLKGIDKKEAGSILDKIRAMARSPQTTPNVTPLKGRDAFRLRVGDYLVIFTLDNGKLIVDVVRVAHRRDVYRQG